MRLRSASKPSLILSILGLALISEVAFLNPARALPWNVEPGTQTDNGLFITGEFNIADELEATPLLLSSNVTVDGLVFAANDAVLSNIPGTGITAIDWVDSSNNLLSLVFNLPLTQQGGTITIDTNVSTYTPFNASNPFTISGSVASRTTPSVPGPLPALGAGVALAWSRNLKRRITLDQRTN